ncbi:MAG: hypothetical protein WCF84_19155 [Anaerolineae bacterium]
MQTDALICAFLPMWANRLPVQGFLHTMAASIGPVIVPAAETPDERHPFISRYADMANGGPVSAATRVPACITTRNALRDVDVDLMPGL